MPELVVIVGVAALVFGPKKLPEVGKSIGKTVKSFQQVSWVFLLICLVSLELVERLYCPVISATFLGERKKVG